VIRSLVLGLALVAVSGVAHAQDDTITPLAIGSKAPMADTKMKSATDGKDYSIASVAGKKGTLVIFTCNHCPWAKAWESRIVALGNEFTKKGVGVITVNSNDPSAYAEDDFANMQEKAKADKMAYPYVVDATSNVARAFGASHTPEAFLFDKDGKLVYHGGIDDNAKEPAQVKDKYLQVALTSVVAGKPVAQAETKTLGCGIKYRKSSS
jgi:alkyl hydroperoxide reductase subunit AhpC